MEGRGAVRTLLRLGRLWRVHAYLDAMAATRCMRVFLMWYVSDLIGAVGAVTGMVLLAARFEGIGVWTRDQVVFMFGYASLAGGIVGVFFSYNVNYISRRLGRGQLDHTLIQPQPLWMALLTEGFSPAFGSAMVLPGIGLMAWAAPRVQVRMTPEWVAAFSVCMLASATILVAFQFLWGTLAFFAPRGAEEISSSTMHMIDELKPMPLDGVGPVLTAGLLTFVPTGFLGWYPCRYLLGLDRSAAALWGTPLAATVLATLAALAFRRGLRHYEQTGSVRYLDMGHRR